MGELNEETILRTRGPHWRRLQELTAKAGHTFRKLSDEELEEFVRLYRQSSADLAFLTTHSSNESVVSYLNEVVGRAYSGLYREPYKPWGQRLVESLEAAADTVRRRRWAVLLSIGLFLAAAITTSGLLAYSDDFRAFYIPSGPMGEVFESWKSGRFDQRTDAQSAGMMFFYASNNPFVSIVANASSVVSFGVLTVVMMWQNGSMLGALGYEMSTVGKLDHLLSSVGPHGVTEMGGIFMAGAGGFVLASALIRPGRRSRAEALRVAGRDAFVLVVLSIVMTLLAAPIEGFFSFDPRIPGWLKTSVALFTLFGWLAFFIGFGRKRSVQGPESPAR
jgi:uncharacterized membrane protein SpoIIM required for sporulation